MREKNFAASSTQIASYISKLLKVEEDKELLFVLEQAKKKGTPPLQMIPTDARHLEVLTKLIRPSKIVEIGTLCGYSTVTLARCLQEGGKVYTCERSQHHANVAQETFKELGLEHKIELVFGEALENLNSLSEMGPFDVVFIDADKDNYPNYFHWAVENLRSGGLLIADNVFCLGYIAQDPPPTDRLGELVDAMKKFNSLCAEDPRLTTTFFPTGEGLLAAVKN